MQVARCWAVELLLLVLRYLNLSSVTCIFIQSPTSKTSGLSGPLRASLRVILRRGRYCLLEGVCILRSTWHTSSLLCWYCTCSHIPGTWYYYTTTSHHSVLCTPSTYLVRSATTELLLLLQVHRGLHVVGRTVDKILPDAEHNVFLVQERTRHIICVCITSTEYFLLILAQYRPANKKHAAGTRVPYVLRITSSPCVHGDTNVNRFYCMQHY